MRTSVIEVRDLLSVLSVEEVEKRIRNVPGVASATVNYAERNATVRYDETRLEVADIKVIVRQRGHQSVDEPIPNDVGPHKSAPNRAVVPMPGGAPATAPTDAVPAPAPVSPAFEVPASHSESDALPRLQPSALAKADSVDDPSVKDAEEVARALGADIENGLA